MKVLKTFVVVFTVFIVSQGFAAKGSDFGQVVLDNVSANLTTTVEKIDSEPTYYAKGKCNNPGRGNKGNNGKGRGNGNAWGNQDCDNSQGGQGNQGSQHGQDNQGGQGQGSQGGHNTQPCTSSCGGSSDGGSTGGSSTTSDGYHGYASYQDYLDAYYAQDDCNNGCGGSGSNSGSSSGSSGATYTFTATISFTAAPTGYFNLGYSHGYTLGNGYSIELVSIEQGCCGDTTLVLAVSHNNYTKHVSITLPAGHQQTVQIGNQYLQLVDFHQASGQQYIRCYLTN